MEDWKSLIDQAMQKETTDVIGAHSTYGQAVRVALSEAQMLLGDLEARIINLPSSAYLATHKF